MAWYGRVTGKAAKNWKRNKERERKALQQGAIGRTGYVYILRIDAGNTYKIGHTTDINRRIKELSAANNSIKCVYSAMVRDRFVVESELHKHFHKNKIEREIFVIPDLSLYSVENLVCKYR